MNYNWNWGILFREPYLGFLITGVITTIQLALIAWVVAFVLGSVLGVMRTLPSRIASSIAAVYVEVFRGIPLLVWFFLWFFVVPELLPREWGRWLKRDLPDPEFWTAVVALGLYTACRVAEQVRAGIQAIPRGQTMAGQAGGLSQAQIYRYILLPLAYRRIVPVLTSEFMTIFKNSSLALTIGVLELTAQARQIESFTFQGFEAFTAATVLYLVITLTVTVIMRQVEARTRIPGLLGQKGG
ncbi:MAG: amino acid ABC transporter permease [Alphaproteobacteria bacterium]|nr:amino acid ABC transporter permease [Alphaproteobacteria bacterium]TAD88132.1 MAG: amino acid ABC transporter permease [Alphaproteobacteria bacterium]